MKFSYRCEFCVSTFLKFTIPLIEESSNLIFDSIDPDSNYLGRLNFQSIFSECKYFSIPEFSVKVQNSSYTDILILCTNIRSFHANFDQFSVIFQNSIQPDILVFCETWFHEENVQELDFYKSYHIFRPGSRGGGCIPIYFR